MNNCNKNKLFFECFLFIFLAILISCKNALIKEPSINSIINSTKNNGNDKIQPPVEITVSQGKIRSVELNWKEVENAVQYKIYSAETPYDSFEQIAETKGNTTSITLIENAGITKYYSIRAVDNNGNDSLDSIIVKGSTMASPIITDIIENENGESVTINWWMSNCKQDTYADKVFYEIHCYNADKKTDAITPKILNQNAQSTVIDGLQSNNLYYFQVNAYLASEQTKMEKSDIIDAETAHKLIPNCVINLTAAKGISTEGIELSFLIPDFVDTEIANKTYSQNPVSFSIERKLISEDDSAYTTIVNYIGTVNKDDNLNTNTNITFDCLTKQTTSSDLIVIPNESPDVQKVLNYKEYIPLSKLIYTDKTVSIDKQYTYRIRSYTDDTKNVISSDSSINTDSGWLISTPALTSSSTYIKDSSDNSKFAAVNVTLNLNFNNFGNNNNYSYIITSQYTPLTTLQNPDPQTEPEEIILITRDLSTLIQKEISYDCSTAKNGYYKYKIYIYPAGVTDITSAPYVSSFSPGTITVTKDATLITTIEDFAVDDGYSNKFILYWRFNDKCKYKLQYITYYPDNTFSEPIEEPLDETSILSKINQNGIVEYEHPAVSGERRQYTLIADSGLPTSLTLENIYKTLASPKPQIEDIDYETIKVSWSDVQGAKKGNVSSYNISAFYNSLPQNQLSTNENTNITYDQNNELFTCVLSKPEGYDDALKSGLPIDLNISVKSENHPESTTTSSITVQTLGPAMINSKIDLNEINQNSIIVQWKKINNADGYIIQRVKYTDCNTLTPSPQTDKYYYDISEGTLSINGETVPSQNATVTISGDNYFLQDFYSAQTDITSSYQSNQSQISWGLPFGYIIIPVKKQSSNDSPSDHFIFDSSDGTKLISNSKIAYKNINPVIGATKGFGFNILANKADNAYTQFISWTSPYYKTFTPTLYRRPANSTDNTWTKVSTSLKKNDTTVNYNPSGLDKYKAFEYIISYGTSSNSITIPESLINFYKTNTDENRYDFKNHTIESTNKGYLLNIPFSASYNGTISTDGTYAKDRNYYSERVEWDMWDYNNRSIGPDNATISILNKNLTSSWQVFANLDSNCYCKNSNSLSTITDTTIELDSVTNSTKAFLTPTKILNGTSFTTTGPLKILRDAYHYYKIEFTKGNITQSIGANLDSSKENYDAVYAYRQATDEEISKSIMIIIADAFNQISEGNTLNGNTGFFHWEDKYNTGIWRELKFQFSNYNHVWNKSNVPGGVAINSFLTLSYPNINLNTVGRTSYGRNFLGAELKTDVSTSSNNCPYFLILDAERDFDSSDFSKLIPIQVTSSIPFDSYNITFNFKTNEKVIFIKINHSDSSEDYSVKIDGNNFKYWNPMRIDDSDYLGKNSTYGWWN